MKDRKPVIFIAGDSTAAQKLPEKRPEAGWGEYLEEFLDPEITIQNFAVNGRSTKTFLEEGRFTEIEKNIQTGDYLLIQFGHNDQKVEDPSRYTRPFIEYQENLALMVEAVRKKGAQPIIFSSVTRRTFLQGKVDETNLGKYPQAALQIAEKLDVANVDMFAVTCALLNSLGEKDSQTLFLHLKPGESVNYPEGVEDDTHFNETGARAIAKLAAEELKKQPLSLHQYVK